MRKPTFVKGLGVLFLSVVSNKSPMFRGCCTTVVAQHYCNKLLRNTMFPKQNKNQNIVKMAHVNTRFILLCQLKLLISILARRRKQKQKKRRSHRFWVRDIFKNRVEKGAFNSLIPELRLHDREYFYRYLRMSPERFEHLLSMIGPKIRKNFAQVENR